MTTKLLVVNFGPDPITIDEVDNEDKLIKTVFIYPQNSFEFWVHGSQNLRLREDKAFKRAVVKDAEGNVIGVHD